PHYYLAIPPIIMKNIKKLIILDISCIGDGAGGVEDGAPLSIRFIAGRSQTSRAEAESTIRRLTGIRKNWRWGWTWSSPSENSMKVQAFTTIPGNSNR
ncbi:MAG: hypothetical protein SV775_02715, partial [Thermodesulfobacteriota bacterium]|nr:hypothetical protein [Thermodesulfobacteriota bacterium]